MNSERDLRENERILIPSWYPPLERQSQQVSEGTPFPDDKEDMGQDLNMEDASFKPSLENLDPQTIEVEDDPELAAIATQLRETASYAINPTFKEELRKKFLQQFVAHHTVETKPIEGIDDILCSQLSTVATDIAKLPTKERNALLSDLGNRLPITEKRKSLEQAFQEEELHLHNSTPHSYENDFEHKTLLRRAYGHIIRLLNRFH